MYDSSSQTTHTILRPEYEPDDLLLYLGINALTNFLLMTFAKHRFGLKK